MNLQTPSGKRILTLITLIAGLLFIARVPLPQRIHGPCLVEPAASWYLGQNNAGQVFTGWERNWLTNSDGRQILANFQRPDLIEVKLDSNVRDGGRILSGDTIAYIASFETAGMLDLFSAELAKAQAMVTALEAGARPADVSVARRLLEQAEVELTTWQPEYERAKSLREAGLISDSMWTQTEGRLKLLQAQRQVAEAQVNALEMGARQEDLEVARREVERLETAIASLNRSQVGWQAITVPLSGRVKLGGVAGEIAKVHRDDTLAAWIRVPEAVLARTSAMQSATVMIFATDREPRKVTINRHQFQPLGSVNPPPGAYAVALIANGAGGLKPGMNGRAWLDFPTMTLLERIRLSIRWW